MTNIYQDMSNNYNVGLSGGQETHQANDSVCFGKKDTFCLQTLIWGVAGSACHLLPRSEQTTLAWIGRCGAMGANLSVICITSYTIFQRLKAARSYFLIATNNAPITNILCHNPTHITSVFIYHINTNKISLS